MEDIKSIVWLLLAVGVFLWQMVQKLKKQTEAADQKQQRRTARQDFGTARPAPIPAPPVPSLSFEELLAQMQRQNRAEESQPAPAPEPVAETRPASVEPQGRYARSQEKTEVEIHSLELPAPEARSLEAPKRAARRADTMPRTSTQHGQEDYWSQPQPPTPVQTRRTVNDLLRSPADIRAAFVLSEILGKKW
ncbi:hypothetical protein [Hymenobacter rubripertinctus]|uniref:Uncharacterized protein n=1 Tax=Hymenobacter rubripertinctus TaxID=2029981 RepID=A0A418R7H8_9BACT|nr:hypothetical protein [Hymenobacter rubripertinctus]RIY13468.1 hypothetical protein D0T11_03270 [Hymenobacter rubripertinctus]